jgi:hypothetical protein
MLALLLSLFLLYRTEWRKGRLEVFPPTRLALASSDLIEFQGNNSDKIVLSFSTHNTGATLKTIESINLTINFEGKKLEWVADGKFDQLKDINLSEDPLEANENYSLFTALSIPPKTHHVSNYVFFYKCDHGWHLPEKP